MLAVWLECVVFVKWSAKLLCVHVHSQILYKK